MYVCFVSAVAGIAYAAAYTYTESARFEEQFFASFILRTIHAFLTASFVVAATIYRHKENDAGVNMIRERRPTIYWFSILASIHLVLPLLRAPSLLLTGGTGIFLFSTFVAIYLAGGWDIAMGIVSKPPKHNETSATVRKSEAA
jgi:hypothetical protein